MKAALNEVIGEGRKGGGDIFYSFSHVFYYCYLSAGDVRISHLFLPLDSRLIGLRCCNAIRNS